MRVCHLSWEYPPVVFGGLGRHVHALAEAQAAAGHDVTVITAHHPDSPAVDVVAGVRVLRAAPIPPTVPFDTDHLLAWVLALNHGLSRTGLASWATLRPDVLHAHDWLVAHAAVNLSAAHDTPVIATIHATESGRHQGWLTSDLSRSIHGIESWLVHLAQGIITCSAHMEMEVTTLFDVPADSIAVIPNGIDTHRWSPHLSKREPSDGPVIVFYGRLEWEKGVHTLIDAVARLRTRIPRLRLIIAGTGSQLPALREQARKRRIARSVTFTGWLPEPQLHALVGSADAVVVPSLYEPFGLVALESAALGTPLAVARTGGLAEFAGADETAMTFTPGDVEDLARAVTTILDDPVRASQRTRRARRRLRDRHSWPALAATTVEFYRQAASGPVRRRVHPSA